MKISDIPTFFKKNPILPTPPFLWKKSEPPLFFQKFEKKIRKLNPPSPFDKGGGSNCVHTRHQKTCHIKMHINEKRLKYEHSYKHKHTYPNKYTQTHIHIKTLTCVDNPEKERNQNSFKTSYEHQKQPPEAFYEKRCS